MENYSYNSSYPDSGNSSPRSREIEYEGAPTPNPSLWDDPSLTGTAAAGSYKAKFMCSYGGKIQPRPHDNQLSYIGGETKILAVDRAIRFSSFIAKLAAVCGVEDASSLSFKYQLPGEDLDALISVTNDDDLEHLMHEYDRLYRSSSKPTRMRLFLFPFVAGTHSSCGSDGAGGAGKFDRDRFVEALNSAPPLSEVPAPPPVKTSQPAPSNNVDFLFGLEKGFPVPIQNQNIGHPATPPPPSQQQQVVRIPDFPSDYQEDRSTGSDISAIQAQLQMLQVKEQYDQHQPQIRVLGYSGRTVEENFTGREYYMQRPAQTEIHQPASLPDTIQPPAPAYWPEKKPAPISGGFTAPLAMTQEHQPVFVMPAPGGGIYHAPAVMRPLGGQPGQGYFVQRVAGLPMAGGTHEVYREQPLYGVVQAPPQPIPSSQQQQIPVGVVPRSSVAEPSPATTAPPGYTQMTYEPSLVRPVFYASPAAVSQPSSLPAPPPVGGASTFSKPSQGSSL